MVAVPWCSSLVRPCSSLVVTVYWYLKHLSAEDSLRPKTISIFFLFPATGKRSRKPLETPPKRCVCFVAEFLYWLILARKESGAASFFFQLPKPVASCSTTRAFPCSPAPARMRFTRHKTSPTQEQRCTEGPRACDRDRVEMKSESNR